MLQKPNLGAFPFLLRRANGPVKHSVLTKLFNSSKKITGVSSSSDTVNVYFDNNADDNDLKDIYGYIIREFTPFSITVSPSVALPSLDNNTISPLKETPALVPRKESSPDVPSVPPSAPIVVPVLLTSENVAPVSAVVSDAPISPAVPSTVVAESTESSMEPLAGASKAPADLCAFITSKKLHRVSLPGKPLLDIALLNGKVALYGVKETWLMDDDGRSIFLAGSYRNRRAACNGYILHGNQIEQVPTFQPVVSLCKIQDWKPLGNCLTGLLYENGTLDTVVHMAPSFNVPKCTLPLDCICSINHNGYVICLSPAALKLFLYLGSDLLYAVPYECTPATSIVFLDRSDYALIAVPEYSFNLIDWKTGKVVKSGDSYPSLVVPVQDSVYIVNDTWTFATVVAAYAFREMDKF